MSDVTIPAPQWVESGAAETTGLDLLALRAPVMRIGNDLLDGITTITPSVRYMTFVAWITLRYWERGGKDSHKSYLEFARCLEAAIVLGNLVVAPDTTGLVGADTASAALEAEGAIPLHIKVGALGTNAYSGPAEQLRLLETQPDAEVPHLTAARGMPLAHALDAAVRGTVLGRRLADADLPQTTTRDELAEFGEHVRLRELPPGERQLLLDAILPTTPRSSEERRRLASYAVFLTCTRGQVARKPRRLLDESVRRDRRFPQCLIPVLDGWARYLVRDMLAVVHEYAFQAILESLPRREEQEPEFVAPADAISTVLQESEAVQVALSDLGLLAAGESVGSLTLADLDRRVADLTSDGELIENGLRRWTGGLQETDVIRVAQQTGVAAPALLPVAWLLAERRVEPGITDGRTEFGDLSREGIGRVGVTQVVRPKLASFRRCGATFHEAAAELAAVTVEQHLRTAWSRLAIEGKDVSVLLSDGPRWAYRKSFAPGRTNSRLGQVDNWLRQLGLVGDDGPTSDGEARLANAVAVLAPGVDA